MAIFNFYQDQKLTMWQRVKFTVEADSLEEARNIVIAETKNQTVGNSKCDKIKVEDEEEDLRDSIELMKTSDNHGLPTLETYGNNTIITHN